MFANVTTNDPASYATAITIGGFSLTGGEARSLIFTNTIALDQYGVDNSSGLALSITGAGTTTLTAAQTWSVSGSGNTTFGKTIANGGFLLTLDGSSTGGGSITSVIGGTGGITKSGSGTWTLSGANTYTGTTTIQAGTLLLGSSNRIGNTTPVTVAGGILDTGIGLTDTVSTFNMSSGSLGGTGTITATTYGLSGGTVTGNLGAGTMNVTGSTALNGTAGATAVNISAGTLTLGASDRLANSAAVVISGGSLALSTFSDTVGAVTLSSGSITGAGTLTGASYSLTNTGSVSAILAGAVNLAKTGAGTATLSGNNTYTGTTTVTAGTLVINGDQTLATGATTVSGVGTRLMGSGTLGGGLTVQSGAIHAPGNGPGLQAIKGATTYNSGSIFEWDLAANKDTSTGGVRGTDYDAVNINGSLTVNSGAIFKVIQNAGVDFTTTFWQTDREWSDIFSATGSMSGWAANTVVSIYDTSNVLQDFSSYGSFTISGTTLSWNAVPEPTTAVVGLLLGAGLLRRRRTSPRRGDA